MLYVQHPKSDTQLVHIYAFTPSSWKQYKKNALAGEKCWAEQHRFTGNPREICFVPDNKGQIVKVLYGKSETAYEQFWDPAWLCSKLQPLQYIFADEEMHTASHALTWQLQTYTFQKYKKFSETFPMLYISKKVDLKEIQSITQAIFLIRDLINTTADDLPPFMLADAAQKVAHQFKANCHITKGKALGKEYPLVHAVGRGSINPPCFTEIQWGNPKHPKITLVGKGITFDTGGLNIKTGSHMNLMKKDMGGAAHALAIGQLIMTLKLPVNLTTLLPSAENAVSGNAIRPSDIVKSRKGLTVEIGDTDAEGRLVLADALARASEDKPALIIDFATLTGSARVALGPEVPVMFTNRSEKAFQIQQLSLENHDPLWPLPLWQPYANTLKSNIADISSVASMPYADAIMAGLFLEKFVDSKAEWIHLDLMAWNLNSKPGRPEGGEATALRTMLAYIKEFIKA